MKVLTYNPGLPTKSRGFSRRPETDPFQAKLVEKIRRRGFVEMLVLLLDLWLQTQERETGTYSGRH